MQKARSHTTKGAPTACRHGGSGTLSLPYYGCFSPFPHGTGPLSVSGECLALAGGPAGFTQGSTCPALLGIPLGCTSLRIRDSHPLRSDFPDCSAHYDFATPWSHNPMKASTLMVWAMPRSLATTGGITFCFLFLRLLRCFSSPGSPSLIKRECQYNILTGCPIRTSAGHRSPAPHRGFSQLATSFIAFLSQGIRPVPLLSFTASLRRTCIRHQDACLCIRRLIVFLLSTTVEVLKSITLGIFSQKENKPFFFCSNMSMNERAF